MVWFLWCSIPFKAIVTISERDRSVNTTKATLHPQLHAQLTWFTLHTFWTPIKPSEITSASLNSQPNERGVTATVTHAMFVNQHRQLAHASTITTNRQIQLVERSPTLLPNSTKRRIFRTTARSHQRDMKFADFSYKQRQLSLQPQRYSVLFASSRRS